jgi:hypothetical protein
MNSLRFNNITVYRNTVAVCVAGLLAAMPPRAALASETDLVPDISVNIGPIAVQFSITKPVTRSASPASPFSSTLHLHVRDDTQTPAFNRGLVKWGERSSLLTSAQPETPLPWDGNCVAAL